MDQFDVTIYLFGKEITRRVTAVDIDAAVKMVQDISILEILKDFTIGDFETGYSAETVG